MKYSKSQFSLAMAISAFILMLVSVPVMYFGIKIGKAALDLDALISTAKFLLIFGVSLAVIGAGLFIGGIVCAFLPEKKGHKIWEG
ncbi:MAG: hypothetical protein K6G10_01415 [Butyrivibrio sp.]|nr:hypothetical protein [Butyrivibrio sp.]